MTVRVGIVKLGNLGTSRYIDLILDERADRDVYVRTVGTGAKLGEPDADEAVAKILEFKPQLCIVISPNGALPGPTKAREAIKAAGVPTIAISDVPMMKVKDDLKAKGLGYFIVKCDSMIGARRQFLDPTEMVLFNADMTKVLAETGVVRLIQTELDRCIGEIASGAAPTVPQIVSMPQRQSRWLATRTRTPRQRPSQRSPPPRKSATSTCSAASCRRKWSSTSSPLPAPTSS